MQQAKAAVRRSLIIIAAALAFSTLSACEPQPPKPKTDIERQAAPEQPPAKPPKPIIGTKPATK